MKKTKILVMATLISVMLSMGGSRAMAQLSGYGKIIPSNDVTQAFDHYRTNPNLVYYFSGSGSGPDAIIGVDKNYSLDSTLWQKITVTPEAVKDLITKMQSLAAELLVSLHGFTILDDKGTPIGVWYSPLNTPTYVKMENGNNIDIATPNQGRLGKLRNSQVP